MSREAEHAKPLPCPLHPDRETVICDSYGVVTNPHYQGPRQVGCGMAGCWRGPLAMTTAEAVARWNEVVGARLKLNEIGVLPIAYVADTDLHHVNDPHETRRRVIVLPIEDKP